MHTIQEDIYLCRNQDEFNCKDHPQRGCNKLKTAVSVESRCAGLPVDVQGQTVSLPAHRGGVGLQQEAAQELDQSLLVSKRIQLAHQSHAQLVLLTARAFS